MCIPATERYKNLTTEHLELEQKAFQLKDREILDLYSQLSKCPVHLPPFCNEL